MSDQHLAAMRQAYTAGTLDETDLAGDWLTQLRRWLADAEAAGVPEPNAMVLATAGADGVVTSRTVLLKGLDERGLVLFTNYGSTKAGALAQNPHASLTFPWVGLQRQVHVLGAASRVDRAETEAYFRSRPRGSQLGAWASPQSQVVPDRATLERSLDQLERRFPDQVPVPEHWGGIRVAPVSVEFWQGRPNRLHDRLRFRHEADGRWAVERLAP